MNIFDELEAQYNEIDIQYSIIEFEAGRRGWEKKETKLQRKRNINDQAYFLFMFSRLEDKIKEESSRLIIMKKSSIASWKSKAAWEILPSQPSEELHFKKRLALLAEIGASNYNLVSEYYKERNSIAHGGNFTRPINMPAVISDLKRLYKVLKA